MSAGSEVELSAPPVEADDAYELQDHEFVLEPDDDERRETHKVAARSLPPPPPLGRRAAGAQDTREPGALRARHGSGVFSRPDPQVQPSAAPEIARLRAQLRARDAYLAELERALDERTRQLALAGIESMADIARLQGRLRGQAFRLAELESELRQLKRQAAELRAEAKSGERPGTALRQIRGIGPRYAQQLASMGVLRVAQVAQWTESDVVRAAEQLHIPASRIVREAWVEQARALAPGEDAPEEEQ